MLNDANCHSKSPACGERIFIDTDFRTAEGTTPLAEAAWSGQIESMRVLLGKGPRNQQINEGVIKPRQKILEMGKK